MVTIKKKKKLEAQRTALPQGYYHEKNGFFVYVPTEHKGAVCAQDQRADERLRSGPTPEQMHHTRLKKIKKKLQSS